MGMAEDAERLRQQYGPIQSETDRLRAAKDVERHNEELQRARWDQINQAIAEFVSLARQQPHLTTRGTFRKNWFIEVRAGHWLTVYLNGSWELKSVPDKDSLAMSYVIAKSGKRAVANSDPKIPDNVRSALVRFLGTGR